VRLKVLNAMLETGLVPVFYNGDAAVAEKIVTACAEGRRTGGRIHQPGRPGVERLHPADCTCLHQFPYADRGA
jgi:hypothetical protein